MEWSMLQLGGREGVAYSVTTVKSPNERKVKNFYKKQVGWYIKLKKYTQDLEYNNQI